MIENECFSKHKLLLLGQFLTKSFLFLSLDVEYFSGVNELNETCQNIFFLNNIYVDVFSSTSKILQFNILGSLVQYLRYCKKTYFSISADTLFQYLDNYPIVKSQIYYIPVNIKILRFLIYFSEYEGFQV